MCIIVLDVYYGPVFLESVLGFGVSSGEFRDYLSNAASFVICGLRRVKDHHTLLHYSSRLNKFCARLVVLDKWFPLSAVRLLRRSPQRAPYARPSR